MYGEVTVAVSDAQFRLGVVGAGIAVAALIATMRFCGSVSIPPKPAPPAPTGNQSQLLTKSAATPAIYQEFLERDAQAAGVPTPTIEQMTAKFAYRVDEARHVLEVGQPAIDIAGVRLEAKRDADALVLEITNTTTSDLAYHVASSPMPNISGCTSARAMLFNAMVIAKGKNEVRVECVWREGMSLAISRVETLEVPPLSAWYLTLVPPRLVGVEDRIARGHKRAEISEKCSTAVSQAVRSGLEQGQIGWRDLVDFYARHRCPTYRFPSGYRAFKTDGERSVPDTAAGM
ncbi:MAG: hypothetical protein JWP01_2091 [Myxococcales bacterium]|nr:hypothetical protein [Myxococcales bacterium]